MPFYFKVPSVGTSFHISAAPLQCLPPVAAALLGRACELGTLPSSGESEAQGSGACLSRIIHGQAWGEPVMLIFRAVAGAREGKSPGEPGGPAQAHLV